MECNRTSIGSHCYIILVVHYFTKWAEAMLTFHNLATTATHFFFHPIITQFGVLKKLVSNHGTYFENAVWHDLATSLTYDLITLFHHHIIHREMAKLRSLTMFLKPCYNAWWISTNPICILTHLPWNND